MASSDDLTDDDRHALIRQVDRAREQGMSVAVACDHVGIKQTAYFAWRRKIDLGPYSAPEAPGPPALGPALDAPATAPPPVAGDVVKGGAAKAGPDLAFLDFRGGAAKDQLALVTRERDELKRILIEVLAGRVAPSDLLEGMFRSHLRERVRTGREEKP